MTTWTLVTGWSFVYGEFLPESWKEKVPPIIDIISDWPWYVWALVGLAVLLLITLEGAYRRSEDERKTVQARESERERYLKDERDKTQKLEAERERRLRPRISVKPTRRYDYACFEVHNYSDADLQHVEVKILSLEIDEPTRDEFFSDQEFLSTMLHWSLDERGDDSDVGSTETRIPAGGSRVIDVFAAVGRSFFIVAANSRVREGGLRRALYGKYRFALCLTAQGISELPIEGYELLCIGGGAGADSWHVEIRPDEERELVDPRYQPLTPDSQGSQDE